MRRGWLLVEAGSRECARVVHVAGEAKGHAVSELRDLGELRPHLDAARPTLAYEHTEQQDAAVG
jgi:hypothetical protein